MVIVGYGRGPIPEGALPVFSVETEKEATSLLALTCPINQDGDYVAEELAMEQSLDNLAAFAYRLELYHHYIQSRPNIPPSLYQALEHMESCRLVLRDKMMEMKITQQGRGEIFDAVVTKTSTISMRKMGRRFRKR